MTALTGTEPASTGDELDPIRRPGQPRPVAGPAWTRRRFTRSAPIRMRAPGWMRQSDELRPEAEALLARIGLRPGDAALGSRLRPERDPRPAGRRGRRRAGGCSAWTPTRRTSPWPRRPRGDPGLGNVEVIRGDARHTGLATGSFDLVHARTLLVTIPEPAEVLAEMARLARLGGWVASQEPDVGHALCYPPLPAWDRLREIFLAAFTRSGADPCIGRRLATMYWQAGLEDVQVQVHAGSLPRGPLAAHGHPRLGAQPAPGDW